MQTDLLNTYTARLTKTGEEVGTGSTVLEVLEAIQVDSKRRFGHHFGFFEYEIDELRNDAGTKKSTLPADVWYERTRK